MARMFSNMYMRFLEEQMRLSSVKPSKYADKLNEANTKTINRFIKAQNKMLKPYLTACIDDTVNAQEAMERKLRTFDLSSHWRYRRINNSFVKQLYKATNAGKDTSPYYETLAKKLAQVKKERDALIEVHRARITASQDTKLSSNERAERIKLYQEQSALAKQAVEERIDQINALSEQKKAEYSAKCNARHEKIKAQLSKVRRPVSALDEGDLLKIDNLSMYFGGLHAVEDLSFTVKKGEIFGLIGPNGAGKTTVFNCITQFYKSTKGDIYFVNNNGITIDLRQKAVHDVILEGISRTFQNVEVIRELTVIENLLIAVTRQYTSNLAVQALHLPLLAREEMEMRMRATKVLDFLGLTAYKDWLAWGLPYGILKKIELARALMAQPTLLILDEPAAGLNNSETAQLSKLIRRIREEFSCTILLIEHDMGLVMDVCDRICAISFGKMLALGTPKEIQQSRLVQEAYLGTDEEVGK